MLFPLLEKIPADLDVDLSLISPTGGTSLPPVVMTTYSGDGEERLVPNLTNLGEWEMISSRDDGNGDPDGGGKSKLAQYSTIDGTISQES